jgi:hypothetical protein
MWWRRKKSLAVVVTCADWRLHQHKVDFVGRLSRMLDVSVSDLLALPGPDGLCLDSRQRDWHSVQDWARLLVGAHHAAAIAVVAHQKCAGHPVSDEEHEVDVVTVTRALKEALDFKGPAAAIVAVHHNDTRWGLKLIAKL